MIYTTLTDLKQTPYNHPVVSFTGSSYPLLFFSLFLDEVKKTESVVFVHELLDSLEQLKAQLSMSFLGNQSLFWLGDIRRLDARRKNDLISYLSTYTGPHAVWFFASDAVGHSIELSDTVDQKEFEQLSSSFVPALAQKNRMFISKLFAKTSMVPFEQACLLVRYQQLIGNRADDFMHSWLHKIMVPDQSLFTLSSLFFGKKAEDFMLAWYTVLDKYSAQFWCAYWSEQLFRAYWYCSFMKAKQLAQAKKIGYRLPFSFLQKEWKKIGVDQLQTMHAQLYEIDHVLKNGVSEEGIFEPLFLQFLCET